MISVVLATYNEEKNIERCLTSVATIAQEIIVVDGSSTDQTAELAKKLGARVISTTNKPNFHINKQMAMDEAQGDLVLQLDADEVVDNQLADFIVSLEKRRSAGIDLSTVAWYIPRKNYFLSRFLTKGGQYPDAVIRLYVRGKARLPQKNVHEQMEVDGAIGTADGHLLHYPYPTFSTYMKKFNTYTSFEASRLHQLGTPITTKNTWKYLFWLPLQTFFLLYIRHKGIVDRMPGFLFAAMSALHHPFVYLKLRELKE